MSPLFVIKKCFPFYDSLYFSGPTVCRSPVRISRLFWNCAGTLRGSILRMEAIESTFKSASNSGSQTSLAQKLIEQRPISTKHFLDKFFSTNFKISLRRNFFKRKDMPSAYLLTSGYHSMGETYPVRKKICRAPGRAYQKTYLKFETRLGLTREHSQVSPPDRDAK
jgi:hypothetical protein